MTWDERREHFRIEDELCFDYCTVEAKDALNEAAITKQLLGENAACYQEIMQYFYNVGNQLSELELSSSQNPDLMHYLKLLNSKIDYLANVFFLNEHKKCAKVSLSLNGMSFKTQDYLNKGSYLKIRINAKPNYIPIILDAKVVYCHFDNEDQYRVGVQFIDISHKNEQTLNQHILFSQTQQTLD